MFCQVKKTIQGFPCIPGSVWIGVYRGCPKNVPIEDRFSDTNPYAASYFRNIIMTSGINGNCLDNRCFGA